jgi:glutaconate CoA-transferase, subunit A
MGKIARRLSLEALVNEFVPPHKTVALGGLHFHNTPMALVRELIRQQVAIACLVPPLDGSINADQLIGTGLVKQVLVAYLGAEIYGLAPRFRAAVEGGSLTVRDFEEAGYTLALQAGASGLPFAALPTDFLPSDQQLPTVGSVNSQDYRALNDPFTGEQTFVVRAITPDVALVHCQFVDTLGNCGYLGAPFLDADIARAAKVCLVQAEQAVEVLPAACRSVLPGYVVDAYCVLPGGAHPASSHGRYSYDDQHIADYIAAAASADDFAHYQTNIIGDSEDAYRVAVNIDERLAMLARTAS